MKSINQLRFQLLGWVLFVFSALFFITSSIRAGDLVGLIGGLLFLFACFVFLIPLVSAMRSSTISDDRQ
ncbi:MAG: cytochrome oxidase subunit III [Proteobacteria bacterium]|nr:cytochrome oxidase subunit III [Pseudomonadota bacterium]